MRELNFIIKLKYNNLITNKEIDKLWSLYHKTFFQYPNGKKTCINCISDSLDNLYKHLLLKNLLTNE